MPLRDLKGTRAVIFDLGDTLYTLPYSIEKYHMKFLKDIFGQDFVITSDQLDVAHEKAEHELSLLVDDRATGPDYSLSIDEWIYFDRVLLETLGVHEELDEKAREYQRLWDRLLKSQPNVLREGAKEVLEELASRGYKIGVATNWAEDPHNLLLSSGIRHLIHSIQWTLVKGYSKPSPYMLIINAHELGVNPLRCAFVGNKVNLDVEAARRAGMRPILLSKSIDSSLEDDIDYIVISDLSELLDIL